VTLAIVMKKIRETAVIANARYCAGSRSALQMRLQREPNRDPPHAFDFSNSSPRQPWFSVLIAGVSGRIQNGRRGARAANQVHRGGPNRFKTAMAGRR
jgi:hypothetical protein